MFRKLITGYFESWLRRRYWKYNYPDPDIWRSIFYSASVHRKPNSAFLFRLYGFKGEVLAEAEIRLNNFGLMSWNDYRLEKMPGEYRVLVLGGEQSASSVANRSWPDFLEIELNRKSDSHRFTAVNCAWPDAGPDHYIEYWKTFGTQFNPDLVIVNFVESDFYRTIQGAPATFKSKPVESITLNYDVDGTVVQLPVTVVKGTTANSLRDANAIAPRPYGFFASRELIQDAQRVQKLQERIVEEQIEGTLPSVGRFTYDLLSLRNGHPRVSVVRNFDPPSPQHVDKTNLVAFGADRFGWIARNIPNVLFTHNFHYGELSSGFEITEAIVKADPQIRVVDMRTRIPAGTSDEEVRSWYMIPHMGEKWNDKGHQVYGQMMADFVLEQVTSRCGEAHPSAE